MSASHVNPSDDGTVNLAALTIAEVGLTEWQTRMLAAHLLGGLAVVVDADTWARLLDRATKDATRQVAS